MIKEQLETRYSTLSRDFTFLTAIILILLGLFALWIGLNSYNKHKAEVAYRLEEQASQADYLLSLEIQRAGHLLESMARQILHIGTNKKEDIATLLRSFDREGAGVNLFAWADNSQQIYISSQEGILPSPINIADRDYMKKSMVDPWNIQIGRPIYGRLSGTEVLPISLGVVDNNGQFKGTLLASINLKTLGKEFRKTLKTQEVDFALLTNGLVPVLNQANDDRFLNDIFPPQNVKHIHDSAHTAQSGQFGNHLESYLTHIRNSSLFPFIYLLGYDMKYQRLEFLSTLWQRLLPVFLFIVFLALALWIIRDRLIRPLYVLKSKLHALQRGEQVESSALTSLPEVAMIDEELSRISQLIQERRRIEHEQKHKLALMKQAKETAEISNRVKLNFMNSMSHELRIPLNTISGFSELMKNEVYGAIENSNYQQYIEDIYQSASLLQSLINDVIALGKAESDMMDLHEKPVQVHAVVSKCIRVLTDRLKETNITVENRASDMLPRLRVDELRLKQIILNLLTNSLSHTPRGGSIVVDAHTLHEPDKEPCFEIIITDYGAKLLPERDETQSVSDQLDDDGRPLPRKRHEIGQTSNLGVPLTRALVAMHQGELDIDATHNSNATRIIVRFSKDRIVS